MQLYLYIHTVLTARVFNDVNRLCRETFLLPNLQADDIMLQWKKTYCLSNKGAKSTCMSSFIIFFLLKSSCCKATLDHDTEISCKGPC